MVSVVVVTAGGAVIAVPAPTGASVAPGAAGRGLITAVLTAAAGGCVTVVTTPASTGGAGRTRA